MKWVFWVLFMAAQVIGTTIGGTVAQPTGLAFQNHLIWAVNDAAWWLFYVGSSSTTTIQTYRSPDGITWTAKTSSPALSLGNYSADGRSFGVSYKNISSKDVVHIDCSDVNGAQTSWQSDHIRATISGGTISWGTWGLSFQGSGGVTSTTQNVPQGMTPCIDSNNLPISNYEWGRTNGGTDVGNDGGTSQATNTDSGSSWTAGFGDATIIDSSTTNACNASCIFDAGGGNLLLLQENGAAAETSSMTNIRWSKRTSSWSAAANVAASNFTAEDPNNFGAVAVGTATVHCVFKTGTNTYLHRKFATSGTTWANGDSIPNQTTDAGAGLAMATDGNNLWLFAINSGSIVYIRWINGMGWDPTWTTLDSPAGTLKYISAWPTLVNNTIGLVFTKTNGSNFDVYFDSLTPVPPNPYTPTVYHIFNMNLMPLLWPADIQVGLGGFPR